MDQLTLHSSPTLLRKALFNYCDFHLNFPHNSPPPPQPLSHRLKYHKGHVCWILIYLWLFLTWSPKIVSFSQLVAVSEVLKDEDKRRRYKPGIWSLQSASNFEGDSWNPGSKFAYYFSSRLSTDPLFCLKFFKITNARGWEWQNWRVCGRFLRNPILCFSRNRKFPLAKWVFTCQGRIKCVLCDLKKFLSLHIESLASKLAYIWHCILQHRLDTIRLLLWRKIFIDPFRCHLIKFGDGGKGGQGQRWCAL